MENENPIAESRGARSVRLARRIFTVAGIYGLLVMIPMYFTEAMIGATYPPRITHAEYDYGFTGLAVCWQVVFLLIARDPIRYRPFMVPAVLEKGVFSLATAVLWIQGRLVLPSLVGGAIDLVLGILFVTAFRATAPGNPGRVPGGSGVAGFRVQGGRIGSEGPAWSGGPAPKRRLIWLALGAFVIATEGFMIAPLLPAMAKDLSVSVGAAGQLVTVFALSYALSSPILTALTGRAGRRPLLITALGTFAAANLIAWASSGYLGIMGARVLLALAAGLYMPSANAVASVVVPPGQRATALAIVTGGASAAMALGVPLGAVIGHLGGWRMAFMGVALLSALATLGLWLGLPRGFGRGLAVATLRQRLAVARDPRVLVALLGTTLWATGGYTIYTYIAVYISAFVGSHGLPLSAVLVAWGIAAVSGIFLGGIISDRTGAPPVIATALTTLTATFAGLSLLPLLVSRAQAPIPFLVAILLWGLSFWACVAPQNARLIGLAGVEVAPAALSLNASFMYFGFSLGAALGAFTLHRGGAAHLGWVGALCECGALGMLRLSTPRQEAELAKAA